MRISFGKVLKSKHSLEATALRWIKRDLTGYRAKRKLRQKASARHEQEPKWKIPFLILVLAVLAIRAMAATPIPPDLVGEWRSPSGNGFLYLRADGLAIVIGGPPPIGFPCIANYDSKSFSLTLSPRFSPADMPKGAEQPPDIKLSYNAKALTITSTGDMGPYKRYSEALIYPYNSIDLQKLTAGVGSTKRQPGVQKQFSGIWTGRIFRSGSGNTDNITVVVNRTETSATVSTFFPGPQTGGTTIDGNTISWNWLLAKWTMTVNDDGQTAQIDCDSPFETCRGTMVKNFDH